MAKKWLMVAPVAGALGIGAGIGVDQLGAAAPGDAKQDVKPAVTLPITRVVLFNSGVGYFSRSGEVADDARVDLTFPEQDINDLLEEHGARGLQRRPHRGGQLRLARADRAHARPASRST